MSNPEEKAIERDYCAGVLTLEEVAEKYGKTVKALRYWAGKHNLTRAKGVRGSKGKSGAKSGQKSGAKQKEKLPHTPPSNTTEKSSKKNPEKISEKILSDDLDDVFDPDEFGISGLQAKFAENVAVGKSLVDSYRLAGYKSEGNAAYVTASQLLRNPKVARAIRWLRDRRQKRLALTEAEIIHQLSSIASMDPNELTQYRRVNCRYCWGEDHQYQWNDMDEYERACDLAIKNESSPPEFGGVGFVESAVPNPDCPRCFGEGKGQQFFADSTMLDGPARWGYLGVKETMNGLEMKIASPEAARKELLAYIKATRGTLPGSGDQPSANKEVLELEGLKLRNEKLQAEIENIRNGKKESNLVVVHNALQVPGAVQQTQQDMQEPSGADQDGE
ncbi:terminase small subunit [Yokenella regensburgei]|uniref:terminase small subunit n=1 Tax=Yokenella regensburgei TaxID=158877 RepID=UPI003EDA7647